MKKKKKMIIIALLISLNIVSSNIAYGDSITGGRQPLSFLTIRTNPGEHFDYALHIAKYLKPSIRLRIQIQEGCLYDDLLFPPNNFDLAIIEIEQELNSTYVDFLEIYSEKGLLGNFGWTREIPYCNQSEQLLKQVNATENEEEKHDYFFDWMTLIMDNILPVLPLFISRNRLSLIVLVFNLRKPFVGGFDNYEFVVVPRKEAYTKGVAVRKAISYCIDKTEINNIVNNNLNMITPYPIIFTGSHVMVNQYYRDLEKAREWIEAAGYGLPGYGGYNSTQFDILYFASSLVLISITFYLKRRKRISG